MLVFSNNAIKVIQLQLDLDNLFREAFWQIIPRMTSLEDDPS